jgi:hypothetical protein
LFQGKCFTGKPAEKPSNAGIEEVAEDANSAAAPMHSERYRRKLRGPLTRLLGGKHRWRFNLCCSKDGCRKRKMPPSPRFLRRNAYMDAMVVLIALM